MSTRFVNMQRVLLCICLLSGLVVGTGLAASCSQGASPTPTQKNVLKVGMLFASGGLGDKSFNDSGYKGLMDAQKNLNIRFEAVEYSGTEADLETLRGFARDGDDLIIGVAFENMKSIETVAKEFPQSKFALIDVELAGSNIASIVYREQEGDFLMGVLDAMLTRTKTVGVIGGMDIPAIKRIISGFKQGVAYQDSQVKVLTDIAGTFSDPAVGLELALRQYSAGADVIHNAASKTGLGIIQAAQRLNRLTTGTSGDQRNLAPGNVVGNRPKRVDTAVQTLIEEVNNGTFKSGTRSLGLKENGLSLGPFDESIVTAAMLNRLEDLKQKIINGEIKVQAD